MSLLFCFYHIVQAYTPNKSPFLSKYLLIILTCLFIYLHIEVSLQSSLLFQSLSFFLTLLFSIFYPCSCSSLWLFRSPLYNLVPCLLPFTVSFSIIQPCSLPPPFYCFVLHYTTLFLPPPYNWFLLNYTTLFLPPTFNCFILNYSTLFLPHYTALFCLLCAFTCFTFNHITSCLPPASYISPTNLPL